MPQLWLHSGHSECGVNQFIVVAAVIDKVNVAVLQLPVRELHIGIGVVFHVIEVGLHMHRIEEFSQILARIDDPFAYLVDTRAVTEQLRRKLFKFRLVVRQARIICRLWARHDGSVLDQSTDRLQYGK